MFLTSCTRKCKVEGGSSVASLDGKMLCLKTSKGGQWVTVDSAKVTRGLFSMRGRVGSVIMAALYMSDEDIIPSVLEDSKVEVSISDTQLAAKGTALDNLLYEFIEKRNVLELQIEEPDRREAHVVLDGVSLEEIHRGLEQEGEALIEEMNGYVKQFIIDSYENMLGPGVFVMTCSTLPYPIMAPQIRGIVRTTPLEFKKNELVKASLSKAKENIQLIEEHQRVKENAPVTGTSGK